MTTDRPASRSALPSRSALIAALWSSGLLALACSSDAGLSTGSDVAEDIAVSEEAAPDGREDTPEPIDCFADRGERPVGDRCAAETDRICLDDMHCRASERCITVAGEPFGTCLYQVPDPVTCPGGPSCSEADAAPLRAAFARRSITPNGFEEARPEFIDVDRGHLVFTGDTTDPDTFFDCGRDMLCPDDPDYTAPDDDGSEADDYFQGAWIAGFDHSRAAARCPAELVGESCALGSACCAHTLAHDDIWAVGAVFEQGESRVAIVSLDLVGYFYSDVQRIVARMPADLGVDLLIVAATHNHEAPDSLGQWGPGFGGGDLPLETGRDPLHMTYIQDQILAVVAEAVDGLEAVDIYAAEVDTGAVGFAVNDGRDPWIFDDDLAVMHVVRAGGDRNASDDTVGVIVNWGSHPESMDEDNPYITSDFPGYVRRYVEEGLAEVVRDAETLDAVSGTGGPVMYLSAAVGGIIGPLSVTAVARDGSEHRDASWEKTDAIGQRVAWAALEAIRSAPLRAGDLSFGLREFVTGVQNLQFHTAFLGLDLFDREIVDWRHDDGLGPDNPPRVVTSVARVQIGPVTFVTVPGEIFPEVLVGGFTAENAFSAPVRGNPERLACDATLLPPATADDPDAIYPCLIDPANPNPPDLSVAPDEGFLKDLLPGEVIFLVGLGNDELGYIVPDYDFRLDDGAPYVAEAPGDHYEETNSVGPSIMRDMLDNLALLFELEQPLFVRR